MKKIEDMCNVYLLEKNIYKRKKNCENDYI